MSYQAKELISAFNTASLSISIQGRFRSSTVKRLQVWQVRMEGTAILPGAGSLLPS